MMTSTSTPSLSVLEQESLIWVNRLLSGAFTPGDAEALGRWRASDAAHEAAFVEAIRFHRRVRRLLTARLEPRDET
ncbi:DUF4880 domain-containing protein [Caulobacter sp. FWC2]|uniref:FecR/PupR family sigma factor regulator n=1 Tax=Caulobacter sp. FWC2 TaxID=69664 RepID=UPI000C15C4A8|nr:hypothetical protein CSW62_15045 [Caulobacter sp. FWC2]